MSKEKKVLAAQLESLFSELDENWNKDEDFQKLFVGCGKAAVKYADSKNANGSIFSLIENAITDICTEKKEKKIEPFFAIDNELYKRIRELVKEALTDMSNLDMIKRHDTAKGFSYEI